MKRNPLFTPALILGLVAACLMACGGVADRPPDMPAPTATSAVIDQKVAPDPTARETESVEARQPEDNLPSNQPGGNPAEAESTQAELDDDRVEGLVAEWETELAPIARLAECVERELGLERPLTPEDFQLQATQPAILTYAQSEVSNE